MDLDALREAIKPGLTPRGLGTALIVMETTHNDAGGAVLPLAYMAAVHGMAEDAGVPVHIDGARVFNAAVKLGVPASEIAAHGESLGFCISKGLSAPVGSVLCGSAAFNDPETDGAFILGGDQDIAMEVLAESPAEAAMASAFDRGVVFGGTSAGAAVESKSMIAGFTGSNGPEDGFAQGSVDVWWANGPDSARRGLIFGSQNIIYDQHFYQRGRFARLLNVVAASDDQFGVSRLGVGVVEHVYRLAPGSA